VDEPEILPLVRCLIYKVLEFPLSNRLRHWADQPRSMTIFVCDDNSHSSFIICRFGCCQFLRNEERAGAAKYQLEPSYDLNSGR
jgi:hypothetical protein